MASNFQPSSSASGRVIIQGKTSRAEMIGIVAAMSQESQAVLRMARQKKHLRIGKLNSFTFSLSGRACVLVTSGMGRQRANEATRALLEKFSPRLIISFGIAGAVEPELDIGDVILPQTYCTWDGAEVGEHIPLALWPEEALKAAAQALEQRGKRVLAGTAVTTVVSQARQNQLGEMPHPVLEMETAGIGQVAAERGIPLFSLRAISDGPRAPIPLDLGEVMDADANLKVGKMLKVVVRNPKILLQARRIMSNTQIATEHAALALAATLAHWDN